MLGPGPGSWGPRPPAHAIPHAQAGAGTPRSRPEGSILWQQNRAAGGGRPTHSRCRPSPPGSTWSSRRSGPGSAGTQGLAGTPRSHKPRGRPAAVGAPAPTSLSPRPGPLLWGSPSPLAVRVCYSHTPSKPPGGACPPQARGPGASQGSASRPAFPLGLTTLGSASGCRACRLWAGPRATSRPAWGPPVPCLSPIHPAATATSGCPLMRHQPPTVLTTRAADSMASRSLALTGGTHGVGAEKRGLGSKGPPAGPGHCPGPPTLGLHWAALRPPSSRPLGLQNSWPGHRRPGQPSAPEVAEVPSREVAVPQELGPLRQGPCRLITPHLHQRRAQSKDAHGQKVLLQPHLHRLVTRLQKERASRGRAPPHPGVRG